MSMQRTCSSRNRSAKPSAPAATSSCARRPPTGRTPASWSRSTRNSSAPSRATPTTMACARVTKFAPSLAATRARTSSCCNSAADTEVGRGDLTIRAQGGGGAFEDHGAMVDDVDAVGELEGHLGVLLDEEHADAFFLQVADG